MRDDDDSDCGGRRSTDDDDGLEAAWLDDEVPESTPESSPAKAKR
jgi:hypothetical protein